MRCERKHSKCLRMSWNCYWLGKLRWERWKRGVPIFALSRRRLGWQTSDWEIHLGASAKHNDRKTLFAWCVKGRKYFVCSFIISFHLILLFDKKTFEKYCSLEMQKLQHWHSVVAQFLVWPCLCLLAQSMLYICRKLFGNWKAIKCRF